MKCKMQSYALYRVLNRSYKTKRKRDSKLYINVSHFSVVIKIEKRLFSSAVIVILYLTFVIQDFCL